MIAFNKNIFITVIVREGRRDKGSAVIDFLSGGAGQFWVCVEIRIADFVHTLAFEAGGKEIHVSRWISSVASVHAPKVINLTK